MSLMSKQHAVGELARAVERADPDDLVEIYNELFPQRPITKDDTNRAAPAVVQTILAHIGQGLEIEEILDLWNVIFPAHRRVWFDEEGDVIHYEEESQPAGRAD